MSCVAFALVTLLGEGRPAVLVLGVQKSVCCAGRRVAVGSATVVVGAPCAGPLSKATLVLQLLSTPVIFWWGRLNTASDQYIFRNQ